MYIYFYKNGLNGLNFPTLNRYFNLSSFRLSLFWRSGISQSIESYKTKEQSENDWREPCLKLRPSVLSEPRYRVRTHHHRSFAAQSWEVSGSRARHFRARQSRFVVLINIATSINLSKFSSAGRGTTCATWVYAR